MERVKGWQEPIHLMGNQARKPYNRGVFPENGGKDVEADPKNAEKINKWGLMICKGYFLVDFFLHNKKA